ncbi:MAG: 2Fe-2S iron-sulfur cluster-binding protein [Pirellulales bacterium]
MGWSAQNIGLVAGWLAVGWVLLQSVTLAVGAWRYRARWERQYAERRAEFCRCVDVAARAARATHAIPDWEGWRPFRVAAIVDEAKDVKSFYLSPVDGRPLSPYAPGQYLTFRLPIASGGKTQLVRCYSLSDRPRQDYFRCTIKRIAAPADRPELPAGRGSSFFHESVQMGDVLDVRAPAGTFHLDPLASEPIVLVGSGIGITPLVSMLDAIVHAGREREVYVVFGFCNSRHQPFREHVQKLALENPNIRLHVSYSSPLAEDVWYRDYNHRGRVTIERLREALPSSNFRFYVCGPGEMMESLVPALWEWGVPEAHVHFEAFGPASVKRVAAGNVAHRFSEPCNVRFERSDRNVTWDGTCASLLELGEANGIALPSGCRAGSCGECMLGVRSGSVLPLKAAGVPVPEGHCLTCISVPTGEIVLDI